MGPGVDPLSAALTALRAGQALTAAGMKMALERTGLDASSVWPSLQRRLRRHPGVVVEGGRAGLTYRLAAPAPVPAPAPAARPGRRPPGSQPPAGADRVGADQAGVGEDRAEAARRRQATVDGLRGLAELAAEVEELVAGGASGEAIVARVRGRARRSGLEPVDHAGARASFDRARHTPIEGGIADAAPVTVVRPGYVWKSPDGEVLISRAVVEQE